PGRNQAGIDAPKSQMTANKTLTAAYYDSRDYRDSARGADAADARAGSQKPGTGKAQLICPVGNKAELEGAIGIRCCRRADAAAQKGGSCKRHRHALQYRVARLKRPGVRRIDERLPAHHRSDVC